MFGSGEKDPREFSKDSFIPIPAQLERRGHTEQPRVSERSPALRLSHVEEVKLRSSN
jgi:hypothetical protein